jgi:hypothetical protein
MASWPIVRPFDIFGVNLVYFMDILVYLLRSWYVVPWKIWQPWCSGESRRLQFRKANEFFFDNPRMDQLIYDTHPRLPFFMLLSRSENSRGPRKKSHGVTFYGT